MEFSNILVWVLMIVVAIGAGLLGGALLLTWHARRQLEHSTKYIIDRLSVVETDVKRLHENWRVLTEYLLRHGLIDEDDLAVLRRELIERPAQREAERNELLGEAAKSGEDVRVIKNITDTYH